MMTVYFVVMTMCSGMEGCVDERKPTAYASRDECMETISAMPAQKGIKYKCRKAPRSELVELRRADGHEAVVTNDTKR